MRRVELGELTWAPDRDALLPLMLGLLPEIADLIVDTRTDLRADPLQKDAGRAVLFRP